MAKKRVYEIAKVLGMESKDLIDKLHKLGFDAKAASSTVDEEDVRRALKKAEEEQRAKTDERRVSSGVIRRRAAGAPEGAAPVAARAAETPRPVAHEAPKPAVEARPSAQEAPKPAPTAAQEAPKPVEVKPAVEAAKPAEAEPLKPAAVEAKPAAQEGPKPAAQEAPKPVEVTAAVDAAKPIEVAKPAAVVTETKPGDAARPAEAVAQPAAEPAKPAVEAVAQPAEEAKPAEAAETKKERREARPARPEARRRDEEQDEDEEKPDLQLEDIGISELDFAAAAETADRGADRVARVAPPPPSTKPAALKTEEEPASKIVRTIDPSVLRARLEGAKRPEPPKDWGRPAPEIAASPVTELVVRTDASGKKKELVDVRKEAARGKAGRTGQRRREEMSAKDLLEHRRGQVYYPTPSRKRVKGRKLVKRPEGAAAVGKQPIEIGETITIAELAKQMSRKATEIIGFLMRQGTMASINQPIPHDTAAMVAIEFGFEVESSIFDEEEHLSGEQREEGSVDPDAVLRAPVVTVMGHVDHGKTSLLDRIRSANVAAGEAGGITQRIAGYQVKTSKGPITFLDTPGHAAFTAMRARGADVTDIVILVVAADDGVMAQTVEAIEHAKAAEVPIIIALNKIDKPDANPDRVLQQLSGHGLVAEEWGGDVLTRRVSAKTGEGIEDLLELIALQAEIMELKANPNLPAVASVIEAQIDKGRGPVATILVQEGTLRIGDIVIAGESVGKVRAMHADGGARIDEAGPSTPVQILGLDGVPSPGDDLRVAPSIDHAKEIAAHRREKRRSAELSGQAKVSLQDLFARMNEGAQKELKIIIKADVQGSVEALREALLPLSTPKVRVSVIHGGVGAVTESDVEFAKASEGIIVGFAVRPDTKALKLARSLGVDIRSYSIIYEAVDEVRLAMQGLLAPVSQEKYLGRAEVRQTFSVPKVGTVAGCAVVDGIIQRSAQIRVLRDSKPIYTGRLASLKRFKDDVREVKEGLECGMGIEKFNDVKVGDIIEAFEIVHVAQPLDDGPGGGGRSKGGASEARA